ncbi:MAG: response regulator, partial [Phaeodactylibacter sp.]|nr:response regulator [Phaeodactylibacter sp.]
MNDQINGHQNERGLIRRNAQSLLRLINQLLDLSKLDSGKLRLEIIRGDIVPYISYLCDSFYSLATDKQVQLQTDFSPSTLIMEYDAEKVLHIVSNLLSNALKFTPSGGLVTLRTSMVKEADEYWLALQIEDSGLGISEAALPHIFERFYQEEKQSSGGTGIGLAISKEMAELMGGSIEVKSTVGQGTTFTVLLPIHNRETLPIQSFEHPPERSTSRVATVGSAEETSEAAGSENPQVLIVEDTPGVVSYLQSLLNENYQLQIATDGQMGIDQAISHIPDLIITDVMMPNKNGFELCDTLKRDERTSHIPIIMLTAKADIDSRLEGLEMGADAYLPKPFEKKELFVRLRKLLELRQVLQKRYTSYVHQKQGPDPAKTVQELPTIEEKFLQKLIAGIESRITDAEITIPEVSRLLAMSHTQLYRKLKAITGKTPSQFIRSVRLQKAKQLLETTDLNISEVGYEVGFTGPQYFSKMFKEEFGYPPSELRDK